MFGQMIHFCRCRTTRAIGTGHGLSGSAGPSRALRARTGLTEAGSERKTGRRLSDARTPGRAFTLIEIMVVLVIMAIAAAIVVPSMLRGGTMSVQAAGRMIIADILVTQNEAIARMAPRRLVFDVANNAYRMTDEGGATIAADWRVGSGSGGGGFEVDFTADRRFTGVNLLEANFNGEPFVEFDALGVPTTGGVVTVDGGTVRYRIAVQPMTGRVSIASIPQD